MKTCISQVTTLSTPIEAEFSAYNQAGWRAVELWLTKVEAFVAEHGLATFQKLLADEKLIPAAASTQGGLLVSSGQERETHWAHFRRRLELLRELNVPTLVLTPDFSPNPDSDQIRRALQSLDEASQLAGQLNVKLALEFPKTSPFCASLDTAAALVAQVDSPHLGLCFDAFHYYTGPSKYEDLAYLTPKNLAWVQLSDLSGTPRELARDADRIFPGDGDFQLTPIIEHLARIGYDGFASLELMNPSIWEIPADRVVGMALQAVERTLGDQLRFPDLQPQADETAGG
jgi:sugar phosphate isomerase/epimerase